jgi:hypothetical protein
MVIKAVLKQLRSHGLNTILATVRGTRGGRSSSKPSSHFSQNGVNWDNLVKVKTVHSDSTEKQHVSFGLVNARSVRNKCTAFREYIADNNLDVVAVTETWLSDNDQVTLGNICPPGYKVISKPRCNGKGGGVAIIYNSMLRVKEVTQKRHTSFEHVEILIQSPDNTGLSLCAVYRPPPNKNNGFTYKQFSEDISDFLDRWVLGKNRLLLCGDFNFHIDNQNDREATDFTHLMGSYGLLQHVHSPTHNKGHTLDLLFTWEADSLVKNVSVLDTQISDHFWVHCKLALKKPKPIQKVVVYRKIKEMDIDAFRRDISESAIGNPTDVDDVDELVTMYNTVLTELLDRHAPKKSLKVMIRSHAPWYTGEIKAAKRECRRAERKWRRTQLTVHKEIYISASQNVSLLIDQAKRSHYGSKVKAANQKSLFKLANSLLNKPRDMALPLYDSAKDLATRFNNFFVQKIVDIRTDLKKIVDNLPQSNASLPATTNLDAIDPSTTKPPTLHTFTPASQDEIKKLIMSTKTTQCSMDPIPTKIVKVVIDALLPVITKIVNLSLSEGVMPSHLKKALLTPLIKKVNLLLEILKNFRPVSNLAYISKVIERVVAKRLITHMDTNKLHEILQSSYKCFHSCETALIKVQNDLLQAIDGKKCVLLVLLDLSAAFDTVDHHKLLQVLSERIGLTGTARKWFESYLSERTQSVVIDGIESEIWKILFGVPQGSVLGPILFIIYTSPLGDILRRHGIMFHLYADDTQLYLSFNVDESKNAFIKMEQCIRDIRTWMASNFLRLNDSKTEVLLIGSKHILKKVPGSELHIGNDNIVPTNTARNIGATFDDTLSMTDHISHMCRGAWFHLKQIGQIRQYLDSSAAATLMHSFVSSRLDSFNGLLFGVPKHQLDKLQRVQNAAARVVTRTRKSEHITPILIDLHWLPIVKRIEYKILLLTFKALHGMAPGYIQDLIKVSKKSRCLRSNTLKLLEVPKTNSVKYGDRTFAYAAPTLWNGLPVECREATSINCFKIKLKTFLFKQAFDLK